MVNLTYTYDKVGNRTRVTELDGSFTTYTYDATYRLINEQRVGANAYQTAHTYDRVGNRLVEETGGARTTFSYDVANQLTTSVAPSAVVTTYSYDGAGNLTTEQAAFTTNRSWNVDNRLTGVGGISYRYNGDGLLVERTTSAGVHNWTWDFQNALRMIREEDGADPKTSVYTLEPRLYGNLISQYLGGASHFHVHDALGSIVALATQGANITNTYTYKAYGDLVASTIGIALNPYRWVGRLGYIHDQGLSINETINQYYVRQRHYGSKTARWLSVDPLGFIAGDINLYRYAADQPLSLTDPSGQFVQAILQIPGVKGCLAGAGWSLGTGLIFGSDQTLCKNLCRAAIGCLMGIISELALSQFPGSARCVLSSGAGAISFLGQDLCNSYCDECIEVKDLSCGLLKSMAAGFIGCLAGEVPLTQLEAWLARFDVLLGSYVAGAACDIFPPPPNVIPDRINPF